MTPMRAISVTICRDRQPGSAVAPLQPLPDEDWQRFRTDVLAALERHVPSDEDTERRRGHTVWDGRVEECETYSRIWATPTPEQIAALESELATLAATADQDAVVLHDERRKLVTAARNAAYLEEPVNTYTAVIQDYVNEEWVTLATEHIDGEDIMAALYRCAESQAVAAGDNWRVLGWVGTGSDPERSGDCAWVTSLDVEQARTSAALKAATTREERRALRLRLADLMSRPERDMAEAVRQECESDPTAWQKYSA